MGPLSYDFVLFPKKNFNWGFQRSQALSQLQLSRSSNKPSRSSLLPFLHLSCNSWSHRILPLGLRSHIRRRRAILAASLSGGVSSSPQTSGEDSLGLGWDLAAVFLTVVSVDALGEKVSPLLCSRWLVDLVLKLLHFQLHFGTQPTHGKNCSKTNYTTVGLENGRTINKQ